MADRRDDTAITGKATRSVISLRPRRRARRCSKRSSLGSRSPLVARLPTSTLSSKGDLRTYKIHLGSGNILMSPNDQYLCIVPGRGSTEHVGRECVSPVRRRQHAFDHPEQSVFAGRRHDDHRSDDHEPDREEVRRKPRGAGPAKRTSPTFVGTASRLSCLLLQGVHHGIDDGEPLEQGDVAKLLVGIDEVVDGDRLVNAPGDGDEVRQPWTIPGSVGVAALRAPAAG